ncbi:chemotaxis protein MotB [Proteiniborus ethanoligenes]|uniref:Chemotaxis protein MotB n=1 Tax=Proteiniborus ethanoligenes TaxID=415015 RepID=A0A1H3QAR9_9FIRM|nr:flagellar motor protein MotB [Proteiniborus ethanoligenes]TAH63641.1 MAG: flagellar motor protein MotB [Gottschalkiaceae bacterium]SDZ10350.1 chemotaxis protein MotB [Proteiniborus ethanoligenes]
MRRTRNNSEEKKGAPEWMTTYGDMVTLLLCFFVLLFSFSEIDAQKFKMIMSSFQGSLGVLESGKTIKPNDFVLDSKTEGLGSIEELENIAKDLGEYLKGKGFSEQVSIEYNERYVKLNFLDGVLFDPGKAVLKDEAIQVLDAVGVKLLEYENNRIKVEGHTDTVPMKSFQYPNNWYLSAARAITVAEYYINEKGFDPKRLSAEGFGEYSPIATNDTAEGRTKNRRIEIKILNSIYDEKNPYDGD